MIIELHILLLFVAAVLLLVLSPGPVVSLIIAETLTYGPKHGLAVAFGAVTVATVFLAIYVAGAAPLMMAMPEYMFDAIRYAGAAFLLYMGWNMYRTAQKQSSDGKEDLDLEGDAVQAYKKAMLAAAANPKAIVFFAAFFPQFVDKGEPITPQLIVLSIVFLIVSLSGDSIWVFTASKARNWLHKKGGAKLIGTMAGCTLALGAILLLFIN